VLRSSSRASARHSVTLRSHLKGHDDVRGCQCGEDAPKAAGQALTFRVPDCDGEAVIVVLNPAPVGGWATKMHAVVIASLNAMPSPSMRGRTRMDWRGPYRPTTGRQEGLETADEGVKPRRVLPVALPAQQDADGGVRHHTRPHPIRSKVRLQTTRPEEAVCFTEEMGWVC